MRKPHLRFALASAVALATAWSAIAAGAQAGSSTVVKTKHTSLGTILVTSSGGTLYLDAGDKPGHFACTGGCLSAWPPLRAVGKLTAAGSAKQADLGKVKGPGGEQVTYRGHPLYTFASDSAGNPTSGEGVGGFYVVGPAGNEITKSTASTTTSSSSAGYYR